MLEINSSNFEKKWHKLDNTANIFPVISNKKFSSVYRISVRLKQDVNPEILLESLEQTLPFFDNFRVRLKRGLFWYYFEANKKHPIIEEENYIPCAYIEPSSNNHFLFKVKYFKKRISLEVFHAITDGAGAINFLKELTYNYIKNFHPEIFINNESNTQTDNVSNIEDSYIKNYEKMNIKSYSKKRAFHLEGEKLPIFTISVIHGYIKQQDLLALCAKNNASITQYLTALIIYCIYFEYKEIHTLNRPIQVTIPVNLRPIFNSTTVMNFFSFIFIRFKIEKKEYSFDEILDFTKHQFKEQLTKENFSKKIAYTVSAQKNIFVRFMPLFLKRFLLKISYTSSANANTTTLSNVGKIEILDEFKEYIEDFQVLISANNSEPFKCTICSFNNKFVITFTSRLVNTDLQRDFFRKLSSAGLDVVIESNGVNNENL